MLQHDVARGFLAFTQHPILGSGNPLDNDQFDDGDDASPLSSLRQASTLSTSFTAFSSALSLELPISDVGNSNTVNTTIVTQRIPSPSMPDFTADYPCDQLDTSSSLQTSANHTALISSLQSSPVIRSGQRPSRFKSVIAASEALDQPILFM